MFNFEIVQLFDLDTSLQTANTDDIQAETRKHHLCGAQHIHVYIYIAVGKQDRKFFFSFAHFDRVLKIQMKYIYPPKCEFICFSSWSVCVYGDDCGDQH